MADGGGDGQQVGYMIKKQFGVCAAVEMGQVLSEGDLEVSVEQPRLRV